MTKKNEMLRQCIKKCENIITSALASQTDDDEQTQNVLYNAVCEIYNTSEICFFNFHSPKGGK